MVQGKVVQLFSRYVTSQLDGGEFIFKPWTVECEYCVWVCTCIWVFSLVITEYWTANHVFGVRTSFETKSTVQMQSCFWRESDVGAITILHSCVINTVESRYLEVNRTEIALNYHEAWNKQVTTIFSCF